jgi:dihydroneopterin aldolase
MPACSRERFQLRPIGFQDFTTPSMDKIFIHDLRIETRIGVYEWERDLPQTIRLDLEIGMPSEAAFASGQLADAIDYARVVARLKAYAKAQPPPLLERFAQAIATLVLDEFGAPWVRVRVAKLAPLPGVKELGVEIERSRMRI